MEAAIDNPMTASSLVLLVVEIDISLEWANSGERTYIW